MNIFIDGVFNTHIFFFTTARWGDDPIWVRIQLDIFFFELGWIYHLGRGTRKRTCWTTEVCIRRRVTTTATSLINALIWSTNHTAPQEAPTTGVEASEHVIANTWRWFQISNRKIPNIHGEHIRVKSTGSEMAPNFLSVNTPTRLTSSICIRICIKKSKPPIRSWKRTLEKYTGNFGPKPVSPMACFLKWFIEVNRLCLKYMLNTPITKLWNPCKTHDLLGVYI